MMVAAKQGESGVRDRQPDACESFSLAAWKGCGSKFTNDGQHPVWLGQSSVMRAARTLWTLQSCLFQLACLCNNLLMKASGEKFYFLFFALAWPQPCQVSKFHEIIAGQSSQSPQRLSPRPHLILEAKKQSLMRLVRKPGLESSFPGSWRGNLSPFALSYPHLVSSGGLLRQNSWENRDVFSVFKFPKKIVGSDSRVKNTVPP